MVGITWCILTSMQQRTPGWAAGIAGNKLLPPSCCWGCSIMCMLLIACLFVQDIMKGWRQHLDGTLHRISCVVTILKAETLILPTTCVCMPPEACFGTCLVCMTELGICARAHKPYAACDACSFSGTLPLQQQQSCDAYVIELDFEQCCVLWLD